MTWLHSHPSARSACRGKLRRGEALLSLMRHAWLLAFLGAACWSSRPGLAQQPAASSEHEARAVFLLNFLKYVEWPSATNSNTNAPLQIGLIGKDRFGVSLSSLVKSKTIDGRAVILEHGDDECAWRQCRLLFVSGSENRRVEEILAAVKDLPVLTVGETEDFLEKGGMISLVMRDKTVRLEINVVAAEAAGLKISSGLLAVADAVKRK
jgi:hypothetical protein